MARFEISLLQDCCFTCQGDVGTLTTYTSKQEIIVFLKAWLSDPTSPRQQEHRDRIRCAARMWNLLCPCAKERWERATQSPRLMITGFSLWTMWFLTQRDDLIRTIERQSGVPLLPPIYSTDSLCGAGCDD